MLTDKPLTFSIVICTDGRPKTLEATLSSLFHLDYEDYEICVVAGPSADGTQETIAKYGGKLKLGSCEERNLSKARNVGIALSAGDIVAFIDDDAVPEPEWLTQLAEGYDRPEVGGVGGFVFDHTGTRLQCGYVTTDRLGRPDASWRRSPQELNFPYSKSYPHLLGTNASFRRSALLEIGGFDEEYEYFLDETDVCCRLIDRGYHLVQFDRAFVHHKFAGGSSRDEQNVVRRWYPLIKNRVYFALKNGSNHHSFQECIQAGLDDTESWAGTVERNAKPGGVYSRAERERFYEETSQALQDGILRGQRPDRSLLKEEMLKELATPFQRIEPRRRRSTRQTLCFVSQDYPPGQNGGIARHIHQLATTLGEAGHNVHILTRGERLETVEYEHEVWVHRLVPTPIALPDVSPIAPHQIPPHIWNWSKVALRAIEEIDQRRPVDVVYAPLWDCEGIAVFLDGKFPLITSLHTTLRHWLLSYTEQLRDRAWMRDLGMPIMALERLLLEESPVIHANSEAIARDVASLYGVDLGNRVEVVPHALQDWRQDYETPAGDDGHVRLLFVGRLEKRKGIDVLLNIAPKLLRRFPNLILDVVGEDSILNSNGRTYRAEFEELDLPEGIGSRVRFHGRCDEDRLREFYAACDIFVAPSRYESFGLVALEAMMFGKPVVSCRTGGLPEVVADGVTGLLAEPGDATSLEQALAMVLEDASLRRQMGTAGRARFQEEFTTNTIAERFEPILSAIRSARNVAQRMAALPTLADIPHELVWTDVGRMWVHKYDQVLTPMLQQNGTFDPREGELMRELVRPEMTVLDVGANIGYFTLLLSRQVGRDGWVTAIEPEPNNFALLQANIDLHDLTNVTAWPLAASDHEDDFFLYLSPTNFGDHRGFESDGYPERVLVHSIPLDQYIDASRCIDFIKIDTQGMDHIVVRGLRKTIERCRPAMLVEFFIDGIRNMGSDPLEVLAFYRHLGFSLTVLLDPPFVLEVGEEASLLERLASLGWGCDLLLTPGRLQTQPIVRWMNKRFVYPPLHEYRRGARS